MNPTRLAMGAGALNLVFICAKLPDFTDQHIAKMLKCWGQLQRLNYNKDEDLSLQELAELIGRQIISVMKSNDDETQQRIRKIIKNEIGFHVMPGEKDWQDMHAYKLCM